MKKILLGLNLILIGLFSSFLFINCSSSKKVVKQNKEKTVKITESEELENKNTKVNLDRIMVYLGDENVVKWRLVSLKSQNASGLYDNLPVMRFDDSWKQIYGTTGCNKFTAYYVKDNNLLSFSRVSATGLPCNNDESQFLESMKTVDEVKEEDSVLSLLSKGEEILIFERY